ncbi:hypothetical protein BCR33DRAFT_771216 [Rhizoclosmatium globosum]|uniref:Uncharacterized protein n=1 Tax=Rhizoclosmatium globosum TaxID=329046 RepID=A0A1Y2BEH7_9FUNG|nr:hypothetical protein BCR33DRAFT_771216 [Rhizoclosmatium globosum]|eukprot:ORY33232.1 hypothetical protein BCR33DRAFT_771216 [Rhizoclosmatium globosum]
MSKYLALQQASGGGAITATLYIDKTYVSSHSKETLSLYVNINNVGPLCNAKATVTQATGSCPSEMNLKSGTLCFSVSCTGDSAIIKSATNSGAFAWFSSCPTSNPYCSFNDSASSQSLQLLPPPAAPQNQATPDPPPVQQPDPASPVQPPDSAPVPALGDTSAPATANASPSAVLPVTTSIVTQSPKAQAIIAPNGGSPKTTLPDNASNPTVESSGAAIGGAVAGIIALFVALGIVYVRNNGSVSQLLPTLFQSKPDIEAPAPTSDFKTPGKRKPLPIPKMERTTDGKFAVPPTNGLSTTVQSATLPLMSTNVVIQKPASAKKPQNAIRTPRSRDRVYVAPAAVDDNALRSKAASPPKGLGAKRSARSLSPKVVKRY